MISKSTALKVDKKLDYFKRLIGLGLITTAAFSPTITLLATGGGFDGLAITLMGAQIVSFITLVVSGINGAKFVSPKAFSVLVTQGVALFCDSLITKELVEFRKVTSSSPAFRDHSKMMDLFSKISNYKKEKTEGVVSAFQSDAYSYASSGWLVRALQRAARNIDYKERHIEEEIDRIMKLPEWPKEKWDNFVQERYLKLQNLNPSSKNFDFYSFMKASSDKSSGVGQSYQARDNADKLFKSTVSTKILKQEKATAANYNQLIKAIKEMPEIFEDHFINNHQLYLDFFDIDKLAKVIKENYFGSKYSQLNELIDKKLQNNEFLKSISTPSSQEHGLELSVDREGKEEQLNKAQKITHLDPLSINYSSNFFANTWAELKEKYSFISKHADKLPALEVYKFNLQNKTILSMLIAGDQQLFVSRQLYSNEQKNELMGLMESNLKSYDSFLDSFKSVITLDLEKNLKTSHSYLKMVSKA